MSKVLEAPPVLSNSPRLTYEEFLDWLDEDTLAEWVDGEVIRMSPASLEHQDLSLWLASAISQFVTLKKNGGRIVVAPFQMKLSRRPSGREPDILFVAKENLEKLRPTFLDGAADLVVEIISPESRARDRGDKFYEYESGGVREYWLLDPMQRRAEWYQRQGETFQTIAAQDGIYRSRVLDGLWLREDWLWNAPPLLDILREWKLI